MTDRSLLLGMGGIFAILALLRPGATTPPSSAPTRTASDTSSAVHPTMGPSRQLRATNAGSIRSGADLLLEFTGVLATDGDPVVAIDSLLDGLTIDVVFATLPDGYDSALDWGFDAYLESIRRAFEASGFVTDRFWLYGRGDSVRVNAQADTSRTVLRAAREVLPGVVLFRGVGESQHRLRLLYIVGEVPTGGVHKEALRFALDEYAILASILPQVRDGGTIRLIGPTFSGSAYSLRLALRPWASQRTIHVISGSATDVAVARMLSTGDVDNRLTYETTVHPDSTLMRVFNDSVVPRLGLCEGRIAVLRESSTQYGDAANREQLSAAEQTTSGRARRECAPKRLEIPFPMNIGSLRGEYARNPQVAPATPVPGMKVEAPRVPLSLQDPVRRKDTPVTLSALTPAALDLVLEEMIRMLRSREIRVVVLLATDIRDKLFLADELKKRLPDLQLVTFESNALYLRSDYVRSLLGTLVLSTYPLILENQDWTRVGRGAAHRYVPFASEAAVGVYNAAALLTDNVAAVEYQSPSDDRSVGQPPVWLTAVGRESFIPLRAFRVDHNPRLATLRSAPASPAAEHPIGFISLVVLLAVCLLTLLVSWPHVRPTLEWLHKKRNGERASADDSSDCAPNSTNPMLMAHHRLARALPSVGVGGILWPVIGVHGAALLEAVGRTNTSIASPDWRWRFGLLLSGGVLAVALFWIIGTSRALYEAGASYWKVTRSQLDVDVSSRAHTGSRRIELMLLGGVLAGGAGYVALAIAYSIGEFTIGARDGFDLFLHRVMNIDGGLSPLVPLTIIGLGWIAWGWWHQRRTFGLLHPTVLEYAMLEQRFGARQPIAPPQSLERGAEDGQGMVVRAVRSMDRTIVTLFRKRASSGRARPLEALDSTRPHNPLSTPDDEAQAELVDEPTRQSGQAARTIAGAVQRRMHDSRTTTVAHDHGRPDPDVVRRSSAPDAGRVDAAETIRAGDRNGAARSDHGAGGADDTCSGLMPSLEETIGDVRRRLLLIVPPRHGLALLAIVMILLVWLMLQTGPILEELAEPSVRISLGIGEAFRVFFWAGIFAAIGITLWTTYRLLSTWTAANRFLMRLADTPLLPAFERLPRRLSRLTRLRLLPGEPSDPAPVVAEDQLQYLRKIIAEDKPALWRSMPEVHHDVLDSLASVELMHGDDEPNRSVAAAQLRAIDGIVSGMWALEPNGEQIRAEIKSNDEPGENDGDSATDRLRRRFSGSAGLWLKVAEEYLATQVTDYIESTLNQLRRLGLFLLACLLLGTALLSSYPFQPHPLVKFVFFCVMVIAILVLISTATQMNRNEVLSRIERTAAGQVTWSTPFVLSLVLYGAIPILALLSSEFPAVRGVLFAWVEPMLHTVAKF